MLAILERSFLFMNMKKRNEYGQKMNLNGIDTLSGYIHRWISEDDMQNGVRNNINQCNYQSGKDRTYLLINPNKQGDGERLITSYSEFLKKMDFIFKNMGADLSEYDVIRADFCFNSRDQSTFDNYAKLHRLLLCCLAKAYNFRNCYQSCNLWDYGRLSVAIKKDDAEAENYNKLRESDGKDESANRLELRSKRMSGTTLEYQLLDKWFERLDRAAGCFEAVQNESNKHLAKLYLDDLQKPPKERDYISLTAFLMRYKEAIYTRRQMIALLSQFPEVKNPEKRADRFKQHHKIEYFSQRDLTHIIGVLKQKTLEYFNT